MIIRYYSSLVYTIVYPFHTILRTQCLDGGFAADAKTLPWPMSVHADPTQPFSEQLTTGGLPYCNTASLGDSRVY